MYVRTKPWFVAAGIIAVAAVAEVGEVAHEAEEVAEVEWTNRLRREVAFEDSREVEEEDKHAASDDVVVTTELEATKAFHLSPWFVVVAVDAAESAVVLPVLSLRVPIPEGVPAAEDEVAAAAPLMLEPPPRESLSLLLPDLSEMSLGGPV